MKFTIILEPKGQKRARGRAFLIGGKAIAGRPRKDDGQLLEEEKLITLMYAYRPPMPMQGPLMLGIKAFLPVPKSKSKKWQAAAQAGEIRPTTKPDLDNLLKHLKDCCKGIFWLDDKQVVGYLPDTGKYYGFPAKWEIEIKRGKTYGKI